MRKITQDNLDGIVKSATAGWSLPPNEREINAIRKAISLTLFVAADSLLQETPYLYQEHLEGMTLANGILIHMYEEFKVDAN